MLRTLGIGGYQSIIQRFGVTKSEDAGYSVTDATRVRAALLESIARDVQKPLALILSAASSLKKRRRYGRRIRTGRIGRDHRE